MADDTQLSPLQLWQALTLLSASVRELTTQVIELRGKVDALTLRYENDRDEIRTFARDAKSALEQAATSQSQEMRAARIDTPLPPPLTRHGRARP